MRKFLLAIGLFIGITGQAQLLIDSFDDGDFTTGPVWTGTTGNFLIVPEAEAGTLTPPGSNTLRLAEFASGTSYLSTPNSTWGSFQAWGLWWGRQGAVDLLNTQYFWLFSDKADITDPTVNGYRLAIIPDPLGIGDPDVMQLQKVIGGSVDQTILEVPFFSAGLTDYGFLVRITRNAANEWALFTSIDVTTLTPGDGEPATSSPFGIGTYTFSSSESGTLVPITGTGYFVIHTESTKAIPGFPEYDQIFFEANGALPVKLENFKAVKDGSSKARLDWKVSIEDNVKGYEIERSINGVNFTRIGFVPATGARNYSFTDEQILSGQNFYRLKTVDNDGTYSYGYIVSVNGSKGSFVKIFPNPASSKLYIQHTDAGMKAQLRIIGMDGRLMQQVRIPENAVLTTLNIEALRSGIYHIIYEYGNGERMVSKFIKQ